MFDYQQHIRESIIESEDPALDKPEQKAFALNLMEVIFSGEDTKDEIMDMIKHGTLPERYKVKDEQCISDKTTEIPDDGTDGSL